MRVIAGSARGRRLKTRKGMETRPTADRIKESLFNILAPHLAEARFLDVFAGNGGVGIEALSRGAEHCIFIEKNSSCATIIRDNLEVTGLSGRSEILKMDAEAALSLLLKKEVRFDLIFFDPPYYSSQLGMALRTAVSLLKPDGLAVVEHHSQDMAWLDESIWTRIREKAYGDTTMSFIIPAAATVDRGAPQEQGGAKDMAIAIYPGSFDPVTNGHRDIIDRASRVFDKVIVSVLENPRKEPLFSIEERVEMLKMIVRNHDNVEVDAFRGLLIDYAKQKNSNIVVKGLRAMSDFEFEFQMALINRKLDSRLETMFMMTNNRYSYVSSSIVKEIAIYGGDICELVPNEVYNIIMRKIREVDGANACK